MFNVKIVDSYLGICKTEDGSALGAYLGFQNKDKSYSIGPIIISDLNSIAGILAVADAVKWEGLIGQAVQIEVEEDKITKMINLIDEDICLNFTDRTQEEDTLNQEVEDITDKVEIV